MSYEYINKLELEVFRNTNHIRKLLNVIKELQNTINELGGEMNKCIEIKHINHNLEKENEEIRDKYRCVVCYDRCKNVVLEPCLHFVCCDKCSDDLVECPICRSVCESRLLVFGV